MSLVWRRQWRLLASLMLGLAVLVVGFGNQRIGALSSSERGAEAKIVTVDIPGRVELFDDTVAHEMSLTYDRADFEALKTTYQTTGEKMFIRASITIDGTYIESVGIRLKGNSTLASLRGNRGGAAAAGPGAAPERMGGGGGVGVAVSFDKPEGLPWLVSFDTYVDGQRYMGYEEIALRPAIGSTNISEALALRLVDVAGEASQRLMYSSLTVNGSPETLRLAIELPESTYADANFDNDGVLYKALSTGKFAYLGDDPVAYDDAFEQITRKKQQDLTPLIGLLKWVTEASSAEFDAHLAEHVDVGSLATYVALQDLLNNFDDMSGPGQNYYLWYDLEDDRFTVLVSDLNLAFGGLGRGGAGGGLPQPGGVVVQPPGSQGGGRGTAPAAGGVPPAGFAPVGGGRVNPGGAGVVPAGGQQGGALGGRGGNALKSKFLASTAFTEVIAKARAATQQALYGSGAALKELDRLEAIVKSSGLVADATVTAEFTSLRTTIAAK